MEPADVGHQARDARESLAWAELERHGSIRPRYLRNLKNEIAAEHVRAHVEVRDELAPDSTNVPD